ncbi:hypothetical protein DPMN_053401 [Dreissena polymorpha]|uniref:Uncharacterized protein n=1 Tax=Dreissena polymorpha TaxID=45954 RepID=A0A9D4HQN9_DREPO|nr:hypothetical protein DPMN_053401 [Dreissena polymorpha]
MKDLFLFKSGFGVGVVVIWGRRARGMVWVRFAHLRGKTAPLTAAMSQDIIGTNLQTKFNDDRKIIGHAFLPIRTIFELNCYIQKTHRKLPRHVFSPICTIFELVQEINKTNVLTNFHDDWAKIVTRVFTRKTAPPTGGHVFQHTGTTFKLNQDII